MGWSEWLHGFAAAHDWTNMDESCSSMRPIGGEMEYVCCALKCSLRIVTRAVMTIEIVRIKIVKGTVTTT
jgi:hypothetical protein